jgi:hypothetical protein
MKSIEDVKKNGTLKAALEVYEHEGKDHVIVDGNRMAGTGEDEQGGATVLLDMGDKSMACCNGSAGGIANLIINILQKYPECKSLIIGYYAEEMRNEIGDRMAEDIRNGSSSALGALRDLEKLARTGKKMVDSDEPTDEPNSGALTAECQRRVLADKCDGNCGKCACEDK